MRMPRTSSFSVRDILDLPQMKTSAEGSVTNGAVDSDAISHATDLYAAASAQRLQGIFIRDDNYITDNSKSSLLESLMTIIVNMCFRIF